MKSRSKDKIESCHRCHNPITDQVFLLPVDGVESGLLGMFCHTCSEIEKKEFYDKNPALKKWNEMIKRTNEKQS